MDSLRDCFHHGALYELSDSESRPESGFGRRLKGQYSGYRKAATAGLGRGLGFMVEARIGQGEARAAATPGTQKDGRPEYSNPNNF